MQTQISKSTILRQAPDSAESEMAGETVVLHLASGTYYGLDETGTYVWSLLKDGACLSDILVAAKARYGIAEKVLEADIGSFLAELIDHDLLMPDGNETA
jgi:hypothetical protein